MRWGAAALCAASLAVISAGAVYTAIEAAKRQFFEPGPLQETVFFDVPKGAGSASVARSLVDQGIVGESGIVPAEFIFREGARHTERDKTIRFGTFEIHAGASMDDILDIITNPTGASDRFRVQLRAGSDGGTVWFGERKAGSESFTKAASYAAGDEIPQIFHELNGSRRSVSYRVAVPEGLTSWQIVQSLKTAGFLSGEPGPVPTEGSLAPDTYSVQNGMDRSDLLERMQEAQQDILAEEWRQKADGLPVDSPEEALILASIVEKETALAEERGLVAAVFVNRLRLGMPLQTDPSVVYGVTSGEAPLGRGLRQSELKRDTPYNTYVHGGLPPTPIANPGRQSIRAALNPDDSDYLYFVADGSGGHSFAETYEEHRKNVRIWRKIEAGNSAEQ